MPRKIMIVLDSQQDQEFLEKVLTRLKYTVISMKEGVDLSRELIDHFPDVVLSSTLGRNARILNALGKIKEVRGKPKLVLVKLKHEKNTLTSEQKKIIDGTLYTPIDPFKLIDVLSHTTEQDERELRKLYNEMLDSERGRRREVTDPFGDSIEGDDGDTDGATASGLTPSEKKKSEHGNGQVLSRLPKKSQTTVVDDSSDFYGTVNADDFPNEESFVSYPQSVAEEATNAETPARADTAELIDEVRQNDSRAGEFGNVEPEEVGEAASRAPVSSEGSTLINDPVRRKKYQEIAEQLKAQPDQPTPIDVQKLITEQHRQAQKVSEDPTVKQNRKHFLNTLFTMSPDSVEKKD